MPTGRMAYARGRICFCGLRAAATTSPARIFACAALLLAGLLFSVEPATAQPLDLRVNSQPVFQVDQNTITPAMSMYLDAVLENVNRSGMQSWPRDASGNRIPGAVVLRITLRKDGYIEAVQSAPVAGQALSDGNAVSASVAALVKGAQPFLPFPPGLFAGYEMIEFGTTIGMYQSGARTGSGTTQFGARGNNERMELRSRISF